MSPDLIWIVATGLTLFGVVGGVIARDRALTAMFNAQIEAVRLEADKEAKALHERINRVRDEYTRRSDLEQHVVMMQTSIQHLAGEVRTHTSETNKRLDNLVAVLIKQAGAHGA